MLTKSFPDSRDSPHDHARAEHRGHADDDDKPAAFSKHIHETPPDSGDSSRRYTEGPQSLERWGAPALGRDQMSSFTGQPSIKGRNESIRMMLLCAIHFGITFTWYGFLVVTLSIFHPRYPTGHQRLLPLRRDVFLQTKWCSDGT